MKYSILKNISLMLKKGVSLSLKQRISSNVRFKAVKGGKISLGLCCSIRENSSLSADGGSIIIGSNCFINRNATIAAHSKITIGKGTSMGPNVCIYDHDHDMHNPGSFICQDIEIGKNVWIGAGAIILKGSKIGDGAVIAAGTVVCGEIPEKTVVLDKRNKVYKNL